jgi:hypothetical protein
MKMVRPAWKHTAFSSVWIWDQEHLLMDWLWWLREKEESKLTPCHLLEQLDG